MAEFVTITVHPSAREGDDLTVQDAMQQVLDIISLLDRAATSDASESPKIVWKLNSATTNSPFSVRAEGASADPAVSVAIQAKKALSQSITDLVADRRRPDWMDVTALRTVKRLADRNLNGIGKTEINAEGDAERITLVAYNARTVSLNVEKALIDEKQLEPDQTHTEYGSAEGIVVAASTYYKHPALFLKERLSGDRVTCVFTSQSAQYTGIRNSLNVVWEGRRVLVKGALHYDSMGRIFRIDADGFEEIPDAYIDLNDIRALDLTMGLSPNAYLNALREVDFND